MFVLMTYDVRAERTRYFRKLIRRYLGHEQYSVFFGDLSPSEQAKLHQEMRKMMVPGDRIIECVAENRNNLDIHFWSKEGDGDGLPQMMEDIRHKADTGVL